MAARWKPPTRGSCAPCEAVARELAHSPLHRPAEALEYGYVADVHFLRPAVARDKPFPRLGAYELAAAPSARTACRAPVRRRAPLRAAHGASRAAGSPRRNGPAHVRRPAAWPAEAVPERPGGFDQLAGHPDHLLIASHPVRQQRRPQERGDNRRRPHAAEQASRGPCPAELNCRSPRCRREAARGLRRAARSPARPPRRRSPRRVRPAPTPRSRRRCSRGRRATSRRRRRP